MIRAPADPDAGFKRCCTLSPRLMGQNGTLAQKLAIIVRHDQAQVDAEENGEVAERLNAPVLKTGVPSPGPWVRIPPSPPFRLFRPCWPPGLGCGMTLSAIKVPLPSRAMRQSPRSARLSRSTARLR
jgi:hypothetical protein